MTRDEFATYNVRARAVHGAAQITINEQDVTASPGRSP
jgi:hypothetical protein